LIPRVAAVEVKNEECHHHQGQSNRYAFEYALNCFGDLVFRFLVPSRNGRRPSRHHDLIPLIGGLGPGHENPSLAICGQNRIGDGSPVAGNLHGK
jgi:hypothetical protein